MSNERTNIASSRHSKNTHKNRRKNNTFVPSIKTIEKHVYSCIFGQDEPVKQIITSIYRGIVFKSLNSNILIIGGSGTGKTETIKQILNVLNLPYTIEDATKYTMEGYQGKSVSGMIKNLYKNAGKDIEKAQSGVVIIDEIDKKSSKTVSNRRDISGVEVLNSLLKIIEGNKVEVDTDVFLDTSNLIIIFLGAFLGIDKIREKRLNLNQVGFLSDKTTASSILDDRILKQDLVNYGLPEEFIGRIGTIIEMNKLTVDDLALILKKSKLSIFRQYQKELKRMGVVLSFNGELFYQIAQKSLLLDTGARELTNTVNYVFDKIIYEVLSNPSKYRRNSSKEPYTVCYMDLDIVEDNTRYRMSK